MKAKNSIFILITTLSCKDETNANCITEDLDFKLNHAEKWMANF